MKEFEWGARDVVMADSVGVDVMLVAVCTKEAVHGRCVGRGVGVAVEAARVTRGGSACKHGPYGTIINDMELAGETEGKGTPEADPAATDAV